MSLNQWKLFIQLKDAISKLSNDKTIPANLTKDFMQILQKLPPSIFKHDLMKYVDNFTNQKSDSNAEGYLPTVIKGIKHKIGKAKEDKVKDVPKWKKSNVQVITKEKKKQVLPIFIYFNF